MVTEILCLRHHHVRTTLGETYLGLLSGAVAVVVVVGLKSGCLGYGLDKRNIIWRASITSVWECERFFVKTRKRVMRRGWGVGRGEGRWRGGER